MKYNKTMYRYPAMYVVSTNNSITNEWYEWKWRYVCMKYVDKGR